MGFLNSSTLKAVLISLVTMAVVSRVRPLRDIVSP